MHYSLHGNEIEMFGEARQKYKISISKLAFAGFILFWDLLLYQYSERLKIDLPIKFIDSYQNIAEIFKDYIIYFKKRFKISKKE